jgi:large subunit ribosomal protein L17
MRHSYYGKKLSRTTNERRRLFRGLLRDLVLRGTIKTSLAKAKAVSPLMDKLITKAKIGTDQKKRELFAIFSDDATVKALLDAAKTRFAGRTSGYTRIIKLGQRRGDAGEEVLFSFVDEAVKVDVIPPVKKSSAPNKSVEKKSEVKEPKKKVAVKKTTTKK